MKMRTLVPGLMLFLTMGQVQVMDLVGRAG